MSSRQHPTHADIFVACAPLTDAFTGSPDPPPPIDDATAETFQVVLATAPKPQAAVAAPAPVQLDAQPAEAGG